MKISKKILEQASHLSDLVQYRYIYEKRFKQICPDKKFQIKGENHIEKHFTYLEMYNSKHTHYMTALIELNEFIKN